MAYQVFPSVKEDQLDDRFKVETSKKLPELDTKIARAFKVTDISEHHISVSNKEDNVSGRFEIDVSKKLTELGNENSRAFEATDMETKKTDIYYALVIDNSYPARLDLIEELSQKRIKNFSNIVTFQIVPISIDKANSLVIIAERPKGKKLSKWIKSGNLFSERELIKRFIIPLCHVIYEFEKINFTHGKINLDNIFIDENKSITLGECYSEICGLSQQNIYENFSRSICNKIAKGEGSPGDVDYYALAISAAFCINKRIIKFLNYSEKEIYNLRTSKGLYKALLEDVNLSSYLLDFFRGSLNESKRKLWNGKVILEDWAKGRDFNFLAPSDHTKLEVPIKFDKVIFFNQKYLSQSLFENWDFAKKFIKTEDFFKWIQRNNKNSKLYERMMHIQRSTSYVEYSSKMDKYDIILFRYITLLDPEGPIRIRDLSFNIDGLGYLLMQKINDSKSPQIIYDLILHGMLVDNIPNDGKTLQSVSILNKSRELLRKRYTGFGIERVLYELCKNQPCLSKSTSASYILSLKDLLIYLESKQGEEYIFDEHLIAYLYSKLDLPLKIRINSLSGFPEFANLKEIHDLAILSLAQKNTKIHKLTNLSKNMIPLAKSALEHYKGKKIKAELLEKINVAAEEGNLTNMLKEITNGKILRKDKAGFMRAKNLYIKNMIKIRKLGNKKVIADIGYLYGMQLCVLSVFFICFIVVIYMLIRVF